MYEEREINLKIVLYQALKNWRGAVILGLILAVIVGGYKLFTGLSIRYDTEEMENAQEQYKIAQDDYFAVGKSLETEILNIRTNQTRQTEYNDNSVLMKINPLNEYVGSFDLYIDSEFQILPELAYQNIDKTRRLISAYQSYLMNGDLYSYILANTNQVNELRYLTEILEFSVNADSAIINVRVSDTDERAANEILNLVKKGIENKYNELSSAIGEHTYSLMNESGYMNVNFDLDTLQKNNIQYLSSLAQELSDKNDEYNEWKKTPEPIMEYSIKKIITSSIKYVIIGGVVGVFLGLIIFAFRAIVTDKVLGSKEIKNHMDIKVIGEIPTRKKKRVFSFVDKMFYGIGDVTIKASAYGECCKLVGYRLDGILDGEDGKIIAFAGKIDKERLKELTTGIKGRKNTYNVSAAGDILSDADAVMTAQNADYIVLVEEQGKSTYSCIAEEVEHLKLWNRKILGVVITEVDAIM